MYGLQDFVQHRLVEDRLGYVNLFLFNGHVICMEYREPDFGNHNAVLGRVDGVKVLEYRANVLVKDLAYRISLCFSLGRVKVNVYRSGN